MRLKLMPLLAILSAVQAWDLSLYEGTACKSAKNIAGYGDSRAMSCQNLDSEACVKAAEATFNDDKFEILVYAGESCIGESNEPATGKCETTEGLFGYSSKVFMSFKVG